MHKRQPEQLSKKRCLQIAEEIGQGKTWVVGFTGGEVLLWPYLFDVIRILKKHGIVVYIVTNGLLLREKAEDIISSGVDTVVVSIDSDQASQHDEIRKVAGLYEAAIDGINTLKRRRKGKRPWLKSTTVVFKSNLEKLDKLVSHLETILDETSIQPIVGDYFDHPHNRSANRLSKYSFTPAESQDVTDKMIKFIEARPAYNQQYFKLIPTYWFDPQKLIENVKCWSPFLRLQIMPGGETRQCTVRADYGATSNLNEDSVMDAWNSTEMIRQREEIRYRRNNCICWTQDTAFNAVINNIGLANHLPVAANRGRKKENEIANHKRT